MVGLVGLGWVGWLVGWVGWLGMWVILLWGGGMAPDLIS